MPSMFDIKNEQSLPISDRKQGRPRSSYGQDVKSEGLKIVIGEETSLH